MDPMSSKFTEPLSERIERATPDYRRAESFNPKHHPNQSFHMENKQNITQDEMIDVSRMDVFLEKSPDFYMSNLNKIPVLPMERWNRYLQHWKNKSDKARRVYLAEVNSILEEALVMKKQVEKYKEINEYSFIFTMLCETIVSKNTLVSKPQMSQQLLNSTSSTLPATDTSGTTFVTSLSMNLRLTLQKQSSDIKVPTQDNEVTQDNEEKKHNTNKPKKHKTKNKAKNKTKNKTQNKKRKSKKKHKKKEEESRPITNTITNTITDT
ncbi:uncharacterized protein LOC116842019 [Odontomachus brunneus]|uniref:uncharacterized protein LOC116842019 n=1 Tax=Odontomachus brunneus TaxID=486640 RepID=UPI0013F1BDA5|nr:uncharacterized protein LOC116842019 [Odontomachus brunneus]